MLPAVNAQRVLSAVESAGIESVIDDSGTVVVVFEHMAAWIHVTDVVLRLVATWRGTSTSPEDHAMMRGFAQAMNTLHCLPKVCVEGEGSEEAPYSVTGEHCFPLTHGMSDEQLAQFITVSLSACLKMMDVLHREFPHLVTWEEEAV